ncbi:amidohydrolase family protein [Chitinophaga cymbidii]|uniref:Amidohydrolase n=1 Tax=Chitinophaga cymbidii TaxID=1096750 RepID=A0A512RDL4_9BACT|nr:amidohydrolase family protein [Chitinophaga cymbidii]GEP93792.1 amidohydrolase [Chitinophaga cymbidii]
MIIDAHQHFWIFDPVRDAWITEDMSAIRRNFLPADLAPVLQANGVDGCVAVQADQSEAETDFLLQLAAENSFVKGVVGWTDLRSARLDERLDHYAQFPLLKGFRHIVQGEPDPAFLLREDFCKGVKALARHDFTYDILIYPYQLPAAVQFVEKFPYQRLVIDHLAKPYIKKGEVKGWEENMRAIGKHEHVYCKLSGMVTEADIRNWKQADFTPYLEVALEAFGPDRLMFGSDWPVCLVAADYPQMKKIVTDFIGTLTPAEQARIMGGNAAAFYKLS